MSIWGNIVGGVVGLATGGVGGAIAGWQGGGALTTPKPPAGMPAPPTFSGGGGINMPFQVTGPGGIPLPGYNPQGVAVAPSGGSCPRGYHLNRKPLAASKRHGAVPAFAMCVRNRHINPLNARAITRSLRRVKRARKLVSKLQSFGATRRLSSGGHKAGCGCFRCRKR